MTTTLLKLEDLTCGYHEIIVVRNVSLEVRGQEIVALIGANGSGKSTILKRIAGLIPPRRGQVWFLGKEISSLPPHEISQMGLVLVPEGGKLFISLSVKENLEMGAYVKRANANMKENLALVFNLFPILESRISQTAGKLSGGERTMLAIARGLMASPKLLALDEPSLGLAPMVTDIVFNGLAQISKTGLSLLLSEQNVHKALSISNRGYVLELGEVKLTDDSLRLLGNELVRKAYLGL
ncbi:MAG: ABC transporter ATP-binding protein [Deltaproteobacteria bacterium]|nr:ABC transporter ATP-binding protein [Deltaproteobacteria bacterium]MBW2025341.1 ABC transporter ATP-binding protein [Deltaproteobacteria bacterium]MBW2125208.1 ABC transporter ATP-binding protein [Deltaproteobacteria bacterium]